MPSPINITNIPAPRVDFIDPRTGLMAREWYRFFFNLFKLTGSGTSEVSLTDLQIGPPVYDFTGEIAQISDTTQLATQSPTNTDQLSESLKRVDALEDAPYSNNGDLLFESLKRIDALEQLPVSADQIYEAIKRIEALEAAPLPQAYTRRAAYGSFYDTTTQTAAAINTAYAMTFNTTDLSFGVTRGSPTSRIYVDSGGVYNIQFSAQLDNTSGGSHLIYIWIRINGVDVPYSASQVRLKGTDGELVAAWNFVEMLKANDYFEIMWSVTDTTVQITSSAAVAPVPAIPSVILTVTDNIST
jgi:hypothetical protein